MTNIRFTNQAYTMLKERGIYKNVEHAVIQLDMILKAEAILVCKEGNNLRIIMWL